MLNEKGTESLYAKHKRPADAVLKGLINAAAVITVVIVVGIIAYHHFIEQRGTRCPQSQQHGKHDEHENDKQRNTALLKSAWGEDGCAVHDGYFKRGFRAEATALW